MQASAAIGGGRYGGGGNIVITGGNFNLIANGKETRTIGHGTGGSGGFLTNGRGDALVAAYYTANNVSDAFEVIGYDYNSLAGATSFDGKWTLYLPVNQEAFAKIDKTLLIKGANRDTFKRGNDLMVLGGTKGEDYQFYGNDLSILTDKKLTILGKTIDSVISLATGITANLTFKDLEIDLSQMDHRGMDSAVCALGNLNLTLEGNNYVRGGSDTLRGGFGIEIRAGQKLTIGGTGSLRAIGGRQAAGIGGHVVTQGTAYPHGDIVISSGKISASGGENAAGIGGSHNEQLQGKTKGTITIRGGIVNAFGGENAAGIGGGSNGVGGKVIITGGNVTATPGSGALNGIGNGVNGGEYTVTDGNNQKVYQATFTKQAEDKAETLELLYPKYNLTGIASENNTWKVYLPEGYTFAKYANKHYRTNVTQDGKAVFSVEQLTVTGGELGKDYTYDELDGKIVIKTDTSMTISGDSKMTRISVNDGIEANLTLKDLKIDVSIFEDFTALDCGKSTVNLTLVGDTLLKSSYGHMPGGGRPGLRVASGATMNIFNGTTGKLEAIGGNNSAGIGGGNGEHSGEVFVSGGIIIARGGENAAGIGGGTNGNGGKVAILGGNIQAKGNSAANIGAGNGMGSPGTLTNGSGDNVYPARFKRSFLDEASLDIIKPTMPKYNLKDVASHVNEWIVYLPAGRALATYEGANYFADVKPGVTAIFYKDADMIARDKLEIERKLKTMSVSNATTDDEIIQLAKSVAWYVEIPQGQTFLKTPATSSTIGSITGNLVLTFNGVSETVVVNKTIEKTSQTPAEQLTAAKASIEAALGAMEVDNTTTDAAVLQAATAGTLHGVGVAWDVPADFVLNKALADNDGSITGTLKLTLGALSDTVQFNISFGLTDEEKLSAAQKSIDTAMKDATYIVNNDMGASDLLTVARAATLHGVDVFWREGSFSKTSATKLTAGEMKGTLALTLNNISDVKYDVTVQKEIEIIALSADDKVLAVKTAIQEELDKVQVSNATTEADVMAVITNLQYPYKNEVTVAWASIGGFNKKKATKRESGTVIGTLVVSVGTVYDTVKLNQTIEKLSFDDDDKLAEARNAIQRAVDSMAVDNDTTEAQIQAVAQKAAIYGVAVTSSAFATTPATSTNEGKITCTLALSLGIKTDTAAVDRTLAKIVISDREKVGEAQAAIQKAINAMAVNNNTKAEDVLQVAENAKLYTDVVLTWETPFAKQNASKEERGSITGRILVKVNQGSSLVDLNKVIEKLEVSDQDKVNQTQIAIQKAVDYMAVSNATTATEMLKVAQDAKLHAETVAWDAVKGFDITNADKENAGKIAGTINISLGAARATVKVNRTIAVLTLSDVAKVTEAKTLVDAMLNSFVAYNSTSAEDVLKAAQNVITAKPYLAGVVVSWKTGAGFAKTLATSSSAGSVTGTLDLIASTQRTEAVLTNKVITQIPTTDAEKMAEAKKAIAEAIGRMNITNATTDEQVMKVAKKAALYNVQVEWDGMGFMTTHATKTKEGEIEAGLDLVLRREKSKLSIKETIAKLIYSDWEKVYDASVAMMQQLNALKIDNDTEENAILTVAKEAKDDIHLTEVSVGWDDTWVFRKQKSTKSQKGLIAGELVVSLNDNSMVVGLDKTIDMIKMEDEDKVAEAKTLIENMFKTFVAYNSTTVDDIKSAVLHAIDVPYLYGVVVSWSVDFAKKDATFEKEGSVTGTIRLAAGIKTADCIIAKTIAKIPGTDEDRVAQAKEAIEAAIARMNVSNATTAQQMLEVAQTATLYGVQVAWEDFTKKEATKDAVGTMSGSLALTLGSAKATVNVSKEIVRLSPGKVLEDEATGVRIEYADGSEFAIGNGAIVALKSKEDMAQYKEQLDKMYPGFVLTNLYDIVLTKDGTAVQPKTLMKVRIPLSEAQLSMKQIQIIYIDEKGNAHIIPSKIENGYLVYYITHLSLYGVMGKVADPEPSADPTQNTKKGAPTTGDAKDISAYTIALLIAGAVILLLVCKKRKASKQK